MPRVVVVGAGVGGLSAAYHLAKAGLEVVVLEAHTYPGGSAGTFFHKGYRFDAGATLLAGFDPGGVFSALAAEGLEFAVRPFMQGEALIEVVLPGGQRVIRPVGPQAEQHAQTEAFGEQVAGFWRWQQVRAKALWQVAPGLPFPPATAQETIKLVQRGVGWGLAQGLALPAIVADAFRSTAARAPTNWAFRRFLDAQLLIASQADAAHTYALFGAAALDLPHRGPVMPLGGMGSIAQGLVKGIQRYGGQVLYRHKAQRLLSHNGRVKAIEVRLGGKQRGQLQTLSADAFVANLTPPDLLGLLGKPSAPPKDGWGAFVVHAVLPEEAIPPGPPYRQWAAEGDWVFVSLSEPGDVQRAPAGQRVLSASVHTPLALWRGLSPSNYAQQKALWQERVVHNLNQLIPGFGQKALLVMAGTPRTYAYYTSRTDGWVGGYPQVHPFRTPSPKSPLANLWRVGESVFPGQSVPAVAMGGERVAALVLHSLGLTKQQPAHNHHPHPLL